MSEQPPEELEVHYGPAGAVAASAVWNKLIVVGDLRRAWPLTDPTLRLVLAQDWLWANREHPNLAAADLDAVAESLAGLTFDHPLWPAFEEIQIRKHRHAWEGFDRGEWGAASATRPIPPDMELVLWQRTGGELVVYRQKTLIEAVHVLLRHVPEEGWLVLSPSDQPPIPGWPPEVPEPRLPVADE